jgi:predicted TIM-barrel fold metal-dependent hydrolase
MLTRRGVLIGGAALASLNAFGQPAELLVITALNFEMPKHACDCHVHVFGDPHRFPFSPSRTYTPPSASFARLRGIHEALHIERAVIVQPSVYGTDNSCTLDAIKRYGAAARGIAVIDQSISSSSLDDMHRIGIRGMRINLGTAGNNDPSVARTRLQEAVAQIGDRGWHVQIYTNLPVIAALERQITASGVPVVFDHFGGAKAELGVSQPGFDALLRLIRSGKAYVKVSGAYRASTERDYADVAPLARALIQANPQRALWGSDWPHPNTVPGHKATEVTPALTIDDGRMLNLFAAWVPDPETRKTILVENPARLYGF